MNTRQRLGHQRRNYFAASKLKKKLINKLDQELIRLKDKLNSLRNISCHLAQRTKLLHKVNQITEPPKQKKRHSEKITTTTTTTTKLCLHRINPFKGTNSLDSNEKPKKTIGNLITK